MFAQHTQKPSQVRYDHRFPRPDAAGKPTRTPTLRRFCTDRLPRWEVPTIDVPGPGPTPWLPRIEAGQSRQALSRGVESRQVCLPATGIAVVYGKSFDQATRMLLLAMVHAVSRKRSGWRPRWTRSASATLKRMLLGASVSRGPR
jgi:hypothetical protein